VQGMSGTSKNHFVLFLFSEHLVLDFITFCPVMIMPVLINYCVNSIPIFMRGNPLSSMVGVQCFQLDFRIKAWFLTTTQWHLCKDDATRRNQGSSFEGN
jgi:hypothetical protein